MDNSTHLTKKNKSLITEFFDTEIKKIEMTLLLNQRNNSNIIAYSKAVYIDSNDDVILLN